MLKIALALLLTTLTLSFNTAKAATGYISDNVYVYIHTGPSAKFRILGSVIAGSKIEIIETSADGTYTKITDDKERTGWVQSKFASTQLSLKERYADLEAKYQSLSSENQELTQASSQAGQNNTRLEQRIASLSSELATAKREKTEIEAKLVGEAAEIQMKWLLNGGILVIISILIGILVTFIPSKKKNKGNWA